MWFCETSRPRHRRPEVERLEQRVLLTVHFTPGPYLTPSQRPDVPLGAISTSSPIEPMLAVNATDPGNIAVSSQNGIRITTNAGATFSSPVDFVSPGSDYFEGDTDLQFDGQGRLFWSNLTGTMAVSVDQINSTTGANITSTRVSIGDDDKPLLTIDTSPGSPFFNNLYVVWDSFAGGPDVMFSRSNNQGVTWSRPLRLSNAFVEGYVWPSDVAVGPNGDVYVAYHSQPGFQAKDVNPNGATGQTFVLRSTDGGVSFAQKTLALGPGRSDVTFNVQTGPRTIPGTQFWTVGSAQPWVLADPVRPGNVYVVTADDPTNGAGAPYSRVVFARSLDNGATWTSPQPGGIIAPRDGDSFQLFPTAAIDQFGNIVVAWYDNRRNLTNASGRFLLDVFATYSTDGGLSWAPSFRVNNADNPFDPDPGADIGFPGPPTTTRIGEYLGIALFGGTAYLAWHGNRFCREIPVDSQVWFSSFALGGALTVTGSPGADTITIRSMAENRDFVEVLVSGRREYIGLWSALTGITIAATAGDTINIEDTVAGVPVIINVGNGADAVNFSSAARGFHGIHGNVTINGQSRNALIAAAEPSTLLSGTVEDIVIGGTTSYDTLPERQVIPMDHRTALVDYHTRVFDLTHGLGVPLLDATVTGNGGSNNLIGGREGPLFYANLALDRYEWDPLTEAFIPV